MISTLQLFAVSAAILGGTGVLALSPALQTNLILVATLLFLIFASWAMLMTARPSPGNATSPALDQPLPLSEGSAGATRRRPSSRALAVFFGLLSSLALLAVCAF
jgi:hypothetical protein